jgi:argininosuccinate synthase
MPNWFITACGSHRFVESTQKEVTGTVTLSLYKGNVSVLSRKSDYSLYRTDLSSFTMGDSYDQKDAEGFIRILGLPSRSRALNREKNPSTAEHAEISQRTQSKQEKAEVVR